MADSTILRFRHYLKSRLGGWSDRLLEGGHPLLARTAAAPLRFVWFLRGLREASRKGGERLRLLAKGRIVPFQRPYWKREEFRAGRERRFFDSKFAASEVERLERDFLKMMGADGFATATSSGRTALELALRALKAERTGRDEVMISTYSCLGVLEPVLRCALKPVFADIGEDLNLSAETAAPLLNERTLAVVAAHLGGKRAEDFEALVESARAAGAVVVEDVCQALGGRSKSGYWGAGASMAIFSFGLGKNLTATAGGMLAAREFVDAVRAEKEKLGVDGAGAALKRFEYLRGAFQRGGLGHLTGVPQMPVEALRSAYGFNRMSGLDARLIRLQLEKMEEIVEGRRRNAEFLIEALEGLDCLSVPGRKGPNVWTKFSVVADSEERLRELWAALRKEGIEPEAMYTPLHLREEGRPHAAGNLPVSEGVYKRVFNLPVRPSLGTKDMEHVARAVRAGLGYRG